MKKYLRFPMILVLIITVAFTACKDDNNDDDQRQTDAEFQALATYLVENDMDLSDILTSWIVTASTVNANLNDYYVIDIRQSTDYDAGHIPGAVNSSLGDILTTATNATGKTIVVACYTGQTAGHAVVALRLSGYSDAQVLMWGMSGWNSSLSASWENSVADAGVADANWIDAPGAIAENMEYDDVDLSVTATTPAEILEERVTTLLTGGFRGINGTDVLSNPGAYFVNNYWAATDVTTYGNIAGASRINPLTLEGEDYIYMDGSKTVVTYCWTGQTSSMITAYLTVLGYDAKSLKFGVNSLIHSELTGHKWATPTTDYTLE